MDAKKFIFSMLFLLIGCAHSFGKQKQEAKQPPNILFILIDDLGWKDVGYMGSCFYETPHIDQLANDGVVFTNAYAPAANCAPSRACIMSGQYPSRHGIYTVGSSERGRAEDRKLIPIPNTTTLADSIITLAETLQKAGYQTAHIGKWHLGDDPCQQGFNLNIAGSHEGHPKSYFSPYKNPKLEDGPEGEYLTDRLTSEAIHFLKENAPHKTGRPFFLYLPYFTVHTPLQGKEASIEKYRHKEDCEGQNHAVYAAMVESADQNVGRLMEALTEFGIRENTLVIFFSDNGGISKFSSQNPLRAGKGSYYEGGIREPLIVSWPAQFPGGKTIDVPVSGIDFYPTLMEAAGISQDVKPILDGESLLPLVKDGKKLERKALYWHFPIYLQAYDPQKDQSRDPLFRTRPGSAMRLGKWKLHEYFENGALELYNLNEDLGETDNLAEKYPRKTKQLHSLLKQWREETKAPVPSELNPQYVPK
ncbi:sulfatase [Carboxylicivirga marina]|uniref:Sulfatase n=1 Tax=Carboxylicivirga marina TaxID=2800988 RepID=A0ABS1HQ13_9BACT|nr:sulfatase [Carboxylicivirga marina]MBK3519736.1 sulfatase [Carboxylicivirga marina]